MSSTFALFQGSPKARLLAAIGGMDQPLHRIQGGSHGQCNRPAPRAVVPETTPGTAPGPSTPTGPKGPCGTTPARPDSPTTPQAGPHGLRPARTGLLAPDPSPIHPARRRRHPHPGGTFHRQPAPLPRRPGPRTPDQLSPRLLPPPLVLLGAGTTVHRHRPRSVRAPRPDRVGRRRHRHGAPRPEGLRQGLSSRPGSVHPLLHRVSLGAQVGRLGRARPLPLYQPPLGVAPADGLVPARGRQPPAWAAAQDTAAAVATDASRAAALVPRPAIRLHR